MSAIESIVTILLAEIDQIVDSKGRRELPEMIRAVGLSKTDEVENLVGISRLRDSLRPRSVVIKVKTLGVEATGGTFTIAL
jgi:hypothetical protein